MSDSMQAELGIPDAGDINEIVRRSVLALAEGEGIPREALGQIIGLSRSATFGKLAAQGARPFTAAEVAQLAAFFEVPVTDFFDGLGGRIRLAHRKGDRIVRLPVPGADSPDDDGTLTRQYGSGRARSTRLAASIRADISGVTGRVA